MVTPSGIENFEKGPPYVDPFRKIFCPGCAFLSIICKSLIFLLLEELPKTLFSLEAPKTLLLELTLILFLMSAESFNSSFTLLT